jgi:hypothetical protein
LRSDANIPMATALPLIAKLLIQHGEVVGSHSDGHGVSYEQRRYWDPNREFIISGDVEITGDPANPKAPIHGAVRCVQVQTWYEGEQHTFSDQNEVIWDGVFERIQALLILDTLASL